MTHDRMFEALQQQHRCDVGKLSLQVAILRRQLANAGLEPDVRGDDDLMRLWQAAAHSVSAASAFVAELGTGKELIDPGLTVRNLTRAA